MNFLEFLSVMPISGARVETTFTATHQGRYVAKTTRIAMKGDYCTREGAERLKDQIEAYWAERGHDVRVNLVSGGFLASMRSARTDVRSNLINGVPTRSTENFA